ncbi:MAG: Hpt domain-containing protein [Proteobacteria bacterium]|nr:Hpt domain-containing protein [Pseudomonadota bacterium]
MNSKNPDAFQLMLQKLRNSFIDEMPEKLVRLEGLLLELEKHPADGEAFDEFYRIVHSLKGSGGTFGLHIITTICHQLEDLLNATDGGSKFTQELISISLNYVDLLRLATEQSRAGNEAFPQVEEQLDKLRKQLARKLFTVLLVDNSNLSTQLYLQILAGLPMNVVVTNDGHNALMRALTETFDLIITSYEIPLLNGVALIGALRLSDAKSRNTKTILITSNKKLITNNRRSADADCTIFKDATLAQSLADAARRALAIA